MGRIVGGTVGDCFSSYVRSVPFLGLSLSEKDVCRGVCLRGMNKIAVVFCEIFDQAKAVLVIQFFFLVSEFSDSHKSCLWRIFSLSVESLFIEAV